MTFSSLALFRSLLYEACGRTINPVSGAIGLMWTGNWDLCQAAADAVLRGESLRALSAIPAAFTDRDMDGLYGNLGASPSSPENSSSAPPASSKKRKGGGNAVVPGHRLPFNAIPASCQQPQPVGLLQSCGGQLDLCLTPGSSPVAGGQRGCGGGGGASDEYSATTTCEDLQATGDVEPRAPVALLNLFN
nr:unnamed protein product [Digitaria exilis]